MRTGPISRRILALILVVLLGCGAAACGGGSAPAAAAPTEAPTEAPTAVPEPKDPNALADGVYVVDVDTDSSMFHINEACEGTGVLTVENGEMTVHIVLPSKSIVNLFSGKAADAAKEGAALIDPTTDSVTYKDDMTEEVYGFDVPVPALDEPFPVAIIGTHGNWYDHTVVVSNPRME
ncbi:MAG: hypothetical protein IJT62_06995 [Oscillospiraceae bacterium]|nr:hypothetical protein [Oscillospiraceae bacterium]